MGDNNSSIEPPPGFSTKNDSRFLVPLEDCNHLEKNESEKIEKDFQNLNLKTDPQNFADDSPTKILTSSTEYKNPSSKLKSKNENKKPEDLQNSKEHLKKESASSRSEEPLSSKKTHTNKEKNDKSDKNTTSKSTSNNKKQNLKYVPAKSSQIRNNNSEDETSKSQETTHSKNEVPHCIICCEPVAYFAVGECNHREVCSICSLRLRELYSEIGCPICKKPLNSVIYTSDATKKYEEYDMKTLIYDESLRVYFDSAEHHASVKKLWLFQCPLCPSLAPFQNFTKLQRHTQQTHGLVYCYVCIKYRKVFLHEQKLYPRSELSKHRLEGDPELKLPPHSYCEYCRIWLFSNDELFLHCCQTHETCFLCESDGIKYQYFRDYAHLEKHFEEAHFPCKEKSCLQTRFVVFKTEFELKVHRVSVHLKGQKIPRHERLVQLDFTNQSFTTPNTNTNTNTSNYTLMSLQSQRPLPRNRYANNIDEDNEEIVSPSSSSSSSSSANNTNTLAPFRLQINESSFSAPLIQSSLQKRDVDRSSTSPRKPLTKEEIASRNRAVTEATRAFLGDDSKFKEFQRASALYRQGQLTVDEYWNKFKSIFNPKDSLALDLFESILDLLPDKDKHLRTALEPKIVQLRQQLEKTSSSTFRRDNLNQNLLGWTSSNVLPERLSTSTSSLTITNNTSNNQTSSTSQTPTLSLEDFPPLPGNETTSLTLTANYSSLLRPRGPLRDEDFPTLSSTTHSRTTTTTTTTSASVSSNTSNEQRKGRNKKKKVVFTWG